MQTNIKGKWGVSTLLHFSKEPVVAIKHPFFSPDSFINQICYQYFADRESLVLDVYVVTLRPHTPMGKCVCVTHCRTGEHGKAVWGGRESKENGVKKRVGAEFVNSLGGGRGARCVTITKQYSLSMVRLLKQLSMDVNRKRKDECCSLSRLICSSPC